MNHSQYTASRSGDDQSHTTSAPVFSSFAGPYNATLSAPHRAQAAFDHGESLVADRRVPFCRKAYTKWTNQEEQNLTRGHNLYGNNWQLIQSSCHLASKDPVQLKDKWRNLVKAGKARA